MLDDEVKPKAIGYNNGFSIRRPKDDNNNRYAMNTKWKIKIERKEKTNQKK